MGILDVEDRIILRGFDHFHEVEVQRRIGAAGQHHEPDDVLADLIHDLSKRDEVASALGHLHRLAAAEQTHHLD